MKALSLSLTLCVSLVTFASLASAKAAPPKSDHPCEKIRAQCEAAGFVKGGHKADDKGLFKDCMQPLMAGQTVAGVTTDTADVAACKEKKADHRKYK